MSATLDTLFITTAIITYSLIFREYKNSQKRLKRYNNDANKSTIVSTRNTANTDGISERSESIWRRIKKSFLFMPSMLITTFILTYAIPDVIDICVVDDTTPLVSKKLLFLMYDIGMFIDPLIYIILLNDVRRFLMRRLKGMAFCSVVGVEHAHSFRSQTQRCTVSTYL